MLANLVLQLREMAIEIPVPHPAVLVPSIFQLVLMLVLLITYCRSRRCGMSRLSAVAMASQILAILIVHLHLILEVNHQIAATGQYNRTLGLSEPLLVMLAIVLLLRWRGLLRRAQSQIVIHQPSGS